MKKRIVIFYLSLVLVAPAFAKLGLEVGVKAPDFKGTNYDGSLISLAEINKNGPVVVVFYRGGWCHFCNLQLKEYQDNLEAFTAQQTAVIAISVDKIEKAAETVKQKELGFYVMTDPEANILELYDVLYTVPAETAKVYKDKYQIDLEAHSGRTDHVIAASATYVIDQDGSIVFVYANEDYKVRPKIEEILEVIKGL